ncbi:hypothetical protein [Paracoccus benzoatiresistens]|nr:hypothetical protein [Paracoccus sp. EF6]
MAEELVISEEVPAECPGKDKPFRDLTPVARRFPLICRPDAGYQKASTGT